MNYPAPDPADLSQVHALNRAFLEHATSGNSRLLAELPSAARDRLVAGGPEARDRVARCPFLLYSLTEREEHLWERFFADQRQGDLLQSAAHPDNAEVQIACATLGMVWQLARRDSYAARVLCGASLSWCERIADTALMDLVRFAATRRELLHFRRAGDAAFWSLLSRAGSDARQVRDAASIACLQWLLTGTDHRRAGRLRAAACAMPAPGPRVARGPDVSQSEARRYNTALHESPVDKKPHQDLRKR
jgi:hypothetical protein